MNRKPSPPPRQRVYLRQSQLAYRREIRPSHSERRLRQRADALARVAARLTLNLDLSSMLSTVCEEAARALRSPGACLYLADNLSGHKLAASTANIASSLPAALTYLPTGMPVPARLDIAGLDWQLIGLAELQQESGSTGWLCLISPAPRSYLHPDEISTLQVFANQAAAAIANARLFELVQAGRNRLQALSRQLVEVQEAERRDIARELHDEIGQTLTGLKINLEVLQHAPASEIPAGLENAGRLVQGLLAQVRQISLDLRPSMLDDLGLLPAMLWLMDHYSTQTRVLVDFLHSGIDRRFPPAVETTAYRIVQEALTNIARHSGTQQATVRLWCNGKTLGLQVEDAGRGFEVAKALAAGTSSGLAGMRERALLAGGQLVIDSSPGAGTRLTAELPLEGRLERRENERQHLAGG